MTGEKQDTLSNEMALQMVADIVTAYVAHNPLPSEGLPDLIQSVHTALRRLAEGEGEKEAAPPPKPAVPIRKSVSDDYIICLEDGKKLKMLKRYLRTHYNMSPEEYREKWNLPADYPMVAPAYARRRSEFAKKIGLGQKGRGRKAASG
ncbi:MAG: transcriptional regulator [Alphaproteobacteria bacterium]|nr:MAG: transcriptional regulator [Alphaproteobacteria bacterium]